MLNIEAEDDPMQAHQIAVWRYIVWNNNDETACFVDRKDAEAFDAEHGGQVFRRRRFIDRN